MTYVATDLSGSTETPQRRERPTERRTAAAESPMLAANPALTRLNGGAGRSTGSHGARDALLAGAGLAAVAILGGGAWMAAHRAAPESAPAPAAVSTTTTDPASTAAPAVAPVMERTTTAASAADTPRPAPVRAASAPRVTTARPVVRTQAAPESSQPDFTQQLNAQSATAARDAVNSLPPAAAATATPPTLSTFQLQTPAAPAEAAPSPATAPSAETQATTPAPAPTPAGPPQA
jgi:hypothetical protein